MNEVFNAFADIGTDCTLIAIELEAFDHRVGKVSWEQRLSDFGCKNPNIERKKHRMKQANNSVSVWMLTIEKELR
jgi:hypothetical protein